MSPARTGHRFSKAVNHRIQRARSRRFAMPDRGLPGDGTEMERNALLDCGWGRLLFAQTFSEPKALAAAMRAEGPDRRDIAFYVDEPHVLLSTAPHELFLDPSHTYRLDLRASRVGRRKPPGVLVRRLCSFEDAAEVNRIYGIHGMVQVSPDFFWSRRDHRVLTHLVAEQESNGAILGTVTGVDHARAFNDPERGSSLWCLAVDGQVAPAGVGEMLIRHLAELMKAREAAFLDLSVLHDNEVAIALYEKLGFVRLPIFAVKRKNSINERLFVGPAPEAGLNPYATLIVDEARRRGIGVEVMDAEGGFFRLTYGGRSIACRESLSELTSGVAVSICDDKAVTRRTVARAGVRVPAQMEAGDSAAVAKFLTEHEAVVVKPARGEQGRGVAVGLTDEAAIEAAIENARRFSDRVIIEAFHDGLDLRLVVIDYRLVAAAIRRPARVVGDGTSSIRELIERQSRRRAAATGGESSIPLDGETERCVAEQGYRLEDILESDQELSGQENGEPPHGRDHPRRHRPRPPHTRRRGGEGGARDRDPGHRDRFHRQKPARARLRLHRGQRTAGARQPRAAADGRTVHRSLISPIDPDERPARPRGTREG